MPKLALLVIALLSIFSTTADARVTFRQETTAECGQTVPSNQTECPLSACCSTSGLCGITDAFCGNGCQGNSCGPTK